MSTCTGVRWHLLIRRSTTLWIAFYSLRRFPLSYYEHPSASNVAPLWQLSYGTPTKIVLIRLRRLWFDAFTSMKITFFIRNTKGYTSRSSSGHRSLPALVCVSTVSPRIPGCQQTTYEDNMKETWTSAALACWPSIRPVFVLSHQATHPHAPC